MGFSLGSSPGLGGYGDAAGDVPIFGLMNKLGLPNPSTSLGVAEENVIQSSALRQQGFQKAYDEFQKYLEDAIDGLEGYGETSKLALDQINKLISDPSSLSSDPGYKLGLENLSARQSGTGDLFSGAGAKDLLDYGQAGIGQAMDKYMRVISGTMAPVQQTANLKATGGQQLAGYHIGEAEAAADPYDFMANYANRADSDAAQLTGSIFGGILGSKGGGGGGGGGDVDQGTMDMYNQTSQSNQNWQMSDGFQMPGSSDTSSGGYGTFDSGVQFTQSMGDDTWTRLGESNQNLYTLK